MWEFIYKVLMLFWERKDKYKHLEEKHNRRIKYFENLKTVENSNLEEIEKRARRNAIAQELIGNQLISYELVDYLVKNKNIINFEIVAKNIALWDTSLIISTNQNHEITEININNGEYKKEKSMMAFSVFFILLIFLCSIYFFKSNVSWMTKVFLSPEYISIIFLICITVALFILFIFLLISFFVLLDLNRIIERVNQ